MRSRRAVRAGMMVLLVACINGLVRSDDTPANDNERADEALKLAKQQAATYRFRVAESGIELTLQPEAVLKWTSPVFGSAFGNCFIWTLKGRPEVIGSFVKWYHPYRRRTDEFQSLSAGSIIGERSGTRAWTSARRGVELALIPDAPAPGSTRTQRLREMRALAAQFTGRNRDQKNIERDLRLLTQPLYRYEGTEGDLVDGALFTLAMGTNPEVFLMIEARKAGGTTKWHYGLCRMTGIQLAVSYRGKEIWTAPSLSSAQMYGHREPYTQIQLDGSTP